MSEFETVHLEPRHFVGIRRVVPMAALSAAFQEMMPKVGAWRQQSGAAPTSPPGTIWHQMDLENQTCDMQVGFFVAAPMEDQGQVSGATTPGGHAIRAVHRGPYDTVGETWRAAYAYVEESGLTPNGPSWELYLNDPAETDPEDLMTEITIPVV